jgi:hypothetical protein
MDTWYQVQGAQMADLRKAAEALVLNEPDMQLQDVRHIIISSMEELDDVIAVSDEEELFDTFRRAETPEFHNQAVSLIREPAGREPLPRKYYPFLLKEVLPLYDKLNW